MQTIADITGGKTMLSPKENALRMIYHENPEYIPMTFETFAVIGMPLSGALDAPLQSGYDPFGIYWHVDSLGGIPDNSKFLFEDIADWEKYVKIPDVSDIDFKGWAERELSGINRDEKLVTYYHSTGIWERAASFMGFENTMINMVEDPDSFDSLLAALTEYRITVARNIIDAYSPDIYVDFNDVATARSLFMSPDMYRELFKPHVQEIIDYVTSRGVIYEQHCCGRCDDLIEDWIEMGVKMWHSAQTMNDIVGIQKKHPDFTIEGGWDSSGIPGMISATEEDVRKEVKRCLDEYGHQGSFILCPVLVNENGNALLSGKDDRFPAMFDEWGKYRNL